MVIVLFCICCLTLLVLAFALSKQKKALLDFDNRIKLLESFKCKLDHDLCEVESN